MSAARRRTERSEPSALDGIPGALGPDEPAVTVDAPTQHVADTHAQSLVASAGAAVEEAPTDPGAADDPSTADEPEGAEAPARHVRRRRAGRSRKPDHEAAPEGVDAADLGHAARHAARAGRVAARVGTTALAVVVIAAVLMATLYGLVLGVNALARWNARRIAAGTITATAVQNNLLVIGVRDGVAVGFTALKAERGTKRVLGIAIPDGAFVEVPGQGFERIGSSFVSGPAVSKDTVTNFLGVQFRRFIVVDGDTYQGLLTTQNVAALMSKVATSDLTPAERTSFGTYFASVKTKDVWIVPLPVKPVAVGDQRYYEPQRQQVADLLLQWWGVKVTDQKSTPRVIVYNGVGTPGLAGLAAQQLIRTGFKVVNSGNADNFDHKQTLILLYHGTQADAAAVRNALGTGVIQVQSSPQDLTDMIVIIGTDYRPPVSDGSTVPTEGVQ